MTILQKFEQEIKDALKSGNQIKLSAVRMIKSTIKNKEIELMHPLSDAEFMAVLSTMAKKCRESIEQFSKGGRAELAKKEEDELGIIESFLPKSLSESELDLLIQEAITAVHAVGPKDMGAVMKALKEKTAGRVDGKLLSDKVRAKLSV